MGSLITEQNVNQSSSTQHVYWWGENITNMCTGEDSSSLSSPACLLVFTGMYWCVLICGLPSIHPPAGYSPGPRDRTNCAGFLNQPSTCSATKLFQKNTLFLRLFLLFEFSLTSYVDRKYRPNGAQRLLYRPLLDNKGTHSRLLYRPLLDNKGTYNGLKKQPSLVRQVVHQMEYKTNAGGCSGNFILSLQLSNSDHTYLMTHCYLIMYTDTHHNPFSSSSYCKRWSEWREVYSITAADTETPASRAYCEGFK